MSESKSVRVGDLPRDLQPREEMNARGARAVSNQVLLAILLRSGLPGQNVVELAGELLGRFGNLTALARANESELCQPAGIGPVKAQQLVASFEFARRMALEGISENPKVSSPEDVAALLRPSARMESVEVFWVLLFSSSMQLLKPPVEVSRGTVSMSLVHPREVFRPAIAMQASSVIVVHNHPSGKLDPSSQDIELTRRLVESGKLLSIEVRDHIILGRASKPGSPDHLSLMEQNLVEF